MNNIIEEIAHRASMALRGEPRIRLTADAVRDVPKEAGVLEITGGVECFIRSKRNIRKELWCLLAQYPDEELYFRYLLFSPLEAVAIGEHLRKHYPMRDTGAGLASHDTGANRKS